MLSKLQDFRLTLLGEELLPVDTVKDLDVVFDSKLLFNDHLTKNDEKSKTTARLTQRDIFKI